MPYSIVNNIGGDLALGIRMQCGMKTLYIHKMTSFWDIDAIALIWFLKRIFQYLVCICTRKLNYLTIKNRYDYGICQNIYCQTGPLCGFDYLKLACSSSEMNLDSASSDGKKSERICIFLRQSSVCKLEIGTFCTSEVLFDPCGPFN